jgi:hypothetical protein
VGFAEFTSPSTPPKYYLIATPSGYLRKNYFFNSDCTGDLCAGIGFPGGEKYERFDVSGASSYDFAGTLTPFSWTQTEPFCDGSNDNDSGTARLFYPDVLSPAVVSSSCSSLSVWATESLTATTATYTACTACFSGGNHEGEVITTLSSEYTTATLKSNTVAALAAYDSDWDDTAGSFANLTTDELSYSIRESRYRLRFKIPTVGTALNFRATWVERFIAEAGVSISSVSVNKSGVYRPTVTLSAPPSGGTQAYAVAVMSSTGTVASISILNIGSGYTSAPTVTVQTASGGGTTSTGWTATLKAGSVTAIAGGTAGDYRPTLAFSGGGGSSATATCTVNAQGGIDVVTMTASGTAYTSEPTLTITPKVSGSTATDLLIHLGTETSKCTVWDGAIPGGYDPATSSTWPILPSAAPNYYSLAVPATDGTTLVANVRTYCDGSTC